VAKRASRANSRELRKIKSYLIKFYGAECNICGKAFPESKLIIEHKDNNPLNWEEKNLQLACQSCNVKKNPPYRKKRDVDNLRVRVCVEDDPKPQSAEMLRNMRSEPTFREWLKKEMSAKLEMEIEDIINSGAEVAEISIDTVKRYLKKLTSRLGPYNLTIDKLKQKFLTWKPNHFPFNNHIKKFNK